MPASPSRKSRRKAKPDAQPVPAVVAQLQPTYRVSGGPDAAAHDGGPVFAGLQWAGYGGERSDGRPWSDRQSDAATASADIDPAPETLDTPANDAGFGRIGPLGLPGDGVPDGDGGGAAAERDDGDLAADGDEPAVQGHVELRADAGLNFVNLLEVFRGAPDGAMEQFLMRAWDDIRPFLDLACLRSNGRYTPETVIAKVCHPSRPMNLWLATDAATGACRGVCITTLVDYDTGLREAQVAAVAGVGIGSANMRRFLAQIAVWAKSWGAHVLYFEGRPGLMRTGPWTRLAVSAEIRL